MLSKAIVLSFFLAAVAGCAPLIVAANERGGDIEHVIGLTKAEAFKKANDHCRQFGRVAQISGYDELGSSMTFNCVDR